MEEESIEIIDFIRMEIQEKMHNRVVHVCNWVQLGIWDGVREPVNQIWHNICWPLKGQVRNLFEREEI